MSPRSGLRRRAALEPPDGPLTPATLDDLRTVYDAHSAELFRYCGRILHDRSHAEEAVQETFVRAWRAADRWDPELGSLRNWLFAIAHNVSTDMLRSRNVRPKLADAASRAKEPLAPSIDDQIGAAMTGWMVEEALRRIRDDQRRAIVETYVRGRPYAEVSRELGVPEGTLRSRVFYGLKALRLALEELGWVDE